MRELLNEVVDMHIHGSPSVAPRIETWNFLKEMDAVGYKAIGLKDHFIDTAGIAYLINNGPVKIGTKVTGSIVLNIACGGLNPAAVDAACLMGARQVFLPTTSSLNHCNYLKKVTSFGGGRLSVDEKPLYLLNKDGTLVEELFPIIKYMQGRPDILLSMGHISPEEIDAIVPYALSSGVKKIIIDHPFFIIGASMDHVERWSRMGAYINFTCSSLQGVGENGHVPLSVLEKVLTVVPEDRLVISTDFGQLYNGSPVEGMYKTIRILINELRVSEDRVRSMTRDIPSMLLGVI